MLNFSPQKVKEGRRINKIEEEEDEKGMVLTIKSIQKAIRFSRSGGGGSFDLDWRFLFLFFFLLLVVSLSFLLFFFLFFSSFSSSYSLSRISNFFSSISTANNNNNNPSTFSTPAPSPSPSTADLHEFEWKQLLGSTRIAVCLLGGARRFELTGPSIVGQILLEYPNSDLFLNCPLDENSYKLSLLKDAPRIASVRIFKPTPIKENDSQIRVLTAANSPNGIQGLLQYFKLVEGCLTLIEEYERRNHMRYEWIVRTRVDGYWSGPLKASSFIPGRYVVPPGSSYGGLNDRFGVGDRNTSVVALSRLSVIPKLDKKLGLRKLNSEGAFKAQLSSSGVPFSTVEQPFCVVSDRRYSFPPGRYGVPVAAMSSRGPLSGAKCRPCTTAKSKSKSDDENFVGRAMGSLEKWWSWTEWRDGRLQLCDAHGEWEKGWEDIFDNFTKNNNNNNNNNSLIGLGYDKIRKRVIGLTAQDCARDFQEMKNKLLATTATTSTTTSAWDAPPSDQICSHLSLVRH